MCKWVAAQRLSFLALFQQLDGKRKMTLRRFEKLVTIGFEFLTTERERDSKVPSGGAILAKTSRRSATKGRTTITIDNKQDFGKVIPSFQKDDDDDDDDLWEETYSDAEGSSVSVLSGDDNVEKILPRSVKEFRQSDLDDNTTNEGKSATTDKAKVDSRNGNDHVASKAENKQVPTNSTSNDSGSPTSSSRDVQYSGDVARKGNHVRSTLSGNSDGRQQIEWEDKFELLREYKETYGSCKVLWKHNCSAKFKGLQRWTGYWIGQIHLYRKNPTHASRNLKADRLKRLTDLGLIAADETSCNPR